LVELTDGGDLPARMLTLYNPPAFLVGCSRAVHTIRGPRVGLISGVGRRFVE
jgi:hypothetical protein